MDTLLTMLEGSRRRWPWAVAGAVGLAVALIVRPTAPLCQDAERHLLNVWDDERRAQILEGLTRTGVPYAAASVQAVAATLDEYAARWVAMRTDACEATRVHGEQTDAQLELRMTCLDGRLRELRALGDRLSTADATTAERAVRAAYNLSDLGDCADVEALASPLPAPTDPAERASVDAMRGKLAEVKSLYEAGQYRPGWSAVQVLVPTYDLAADDTHLYLAYEQRIERLPLSDLANAQPEIVLADAEEYVGGILVDDEFFYYAESTFVGSIHRIPK